MKKSYWVILLLVIILAGIVLVMLQQNKSIKSENNNLCETVISLSDIKNTCNTQIHEDINGSYYITPKNTAIDSIGNQAELSEGEISRCLREIVTNDYESYAQSTNPKGSELMIVVSTLDSADSANKYYEETVYSYNESNSWDRASKDALVLNENITQFGDKGNILLYKAKDIIIPEENIQSVHQSKTLGISYLKGTKVIWLSSAAYNQNTPLLCELDNLKKVAEIIDKNIK